MPKPLHLALLVSAIWAGNVLAQGHTYDLPTQNLGSALTKLAKQGGIQILFDADAFLGRQSPELRGTYSAEEALGKLLAGSGYQAVATARGTYVIQKRPPAEGTLHLPEVVVTASAERSYAAPRANIAGKVPLSLREVPNSVSVLTREQIEDQKLVTMPEALQQVTGVNVVTNDTLNSQYWARGYGLGVMYDGVTSYNGMTPSHQFDLPLYERIEVLRGPAGLLRGVGEPGGVVNLVKKRAKDKFGFSAAISAGSWDNYRFDADLTGPLNEAKTLRGRMVVSEEDRDYFYDHTHGQKWLAMGALEFDLTRQTTLSLSLTAQDAEIKAPWSGLPTSNQVDSSGHYKLLDVSRSTFNAPDWGKLRYRMEEVSAAVEHRFDNKWVAKLSANHRTWNQFYKYAYTSSSVNTTTNRVSYATMQGDFDYTRDGLDLFANGPFELFGRTHNLLIGYNSETYKYSGRSGRGPSYSNVLFGDVSGVVEPTIAYTSGSENETEQSGFYSQLRFSLADPLTLVLGGRTTTFSNRWRNIAPSTTGLNWKDGAKANNEFTPYGGLLFDITKEITLYASYADIFVPQTQLKANGSTLDPRVGRQYEVGAKSEFFNGKLAASLAWFNIRDKNRAYADPGDPTGTYYLNAGEVESSGWETEISGQPMRGLDVMAGYTYLNTRYLKDVSNEGKSYSIFSPRHQLKLWSNYRFADGVLEKLSLGLGMLAQSAAQSTRGWRDEVVNTGYAVFNGRIAYEIDKHYSLSLNVNNLLDRKYYASVGTTNIYNFYGEPRSFMLTLRATY